MSYDEKSAWVMGIVAVVAWATYAAVVTGRVEGSWAETAYVVPMLWAIGGAIVVSIAIHIVLGAVGGPEARARDTRDAEIHRFGEHVGSSLIQVGAVGAMVLALADVDHFWIANAIYLGFVLSAILSSVAKIVSYRTGLPW